MRARVLRSPFASRACVSLLLSLACLAGTSAAHADERVTKQSCIAASEKAQQLRNEHRLVEARVALLSCVAEECPGAVRNDCVSWLAQVTQLIPTVVLAAHDEANTDVSDVRVTLDQLPLVTSLDGASIPVAPGEHVFRFERDGYAPVIKRVILREGETARKIEVTFGAPSSGSADKGPGIAPWLIVGVGGAAIVTGVALAVIAPNNIPVGCSNNTCDNRFNNGTLNSGGTASALAGSLLCSDTPTLDGCSKSAFNVKRQQDAQNASTMQVVGVFTTIAGGAIAAGGLVYYLVARPKAPAESAWLAPLVTDKVQGLALGGTF